MKKIKQMFQKPKMTIFFYTLAIILLGYTMYTGYTSYEYIAGLVTAGSITWASSISDIIGYFIANSSSYLFYALAFIFFGYACNYLNPKPQMEVAPQEQIEEVEELQDMVMNTEVTEG